MAVLLETSNGVRVDEAVSLDDLEALRPEWSELHARCPGATSFQTPEWCITWWRHFGQGDLWVIATGEDGALTGLAPLFITRKDSCSPREVFLLGTGISDYLDILAHPDHERAVVTALVRHLQAATGRWDVCDFQQLRSGSALLNLETPSEWSSELMVQEVCPVLALPAESGHLKRAVPGHMLEKLAYYRRKASKPGELLMEQAGPENFDELFDAFLSLHQARWVGRSSEGTLADAALQQFHREVARGFLEAGALRLYGLRLSGKLIAALYAFASARSTLHYLSGFNPEHASLGPGTILIGHAIETAIQEGHVEFDFLRGRETYKYMWGARGRLNCRRRFRH